MLMIFLFFFHCKFTPKYGMFGMYLVSLKAPSGVDTYNSE